MANEVIFDTSNRRVPQLPAPGKRIKLLIDSDTKNEIDDQYAIALAIYSPERFDIKGFVGANFDNVRGGADSVQKSVDEIKLVLEKAGMSGKWPVLAGSDPMCYQFQPSMSEGVEFIVEEAMKCSEEDPLWVVTLGSSTNPASAILHTPEIARRINLVYHGRTRWPELCYNFNVIGDVRAARILFHSDVPMVLFDTGTYLTAPMAETEEQLAPYGALGAYLHEYRKTSPHFSTPKKGFFDLGDIAVLYDPKLGCFEQTASPTVGWDLRYDHARTHGEILRCYHVDRDGTFAALYRQVQNANR